MNRHQRRNFTSPTKREAFRRSNGICECHLIPHVFDVACGCPLGAGNTFYEHIDPDAICGRNDLDNCAALTKTCWNFKTNNHDKPVIARAKRRHDRFRGIRPNVSRPITGTIASGIKLRIGGGRPLDRRTGREL